MIPFGVKRSGPARSLTTRRIYKTIRSSMKPVVQYRYRPKQGWSEQRTNNHVYDIFRRRAQHGQKDPIHARRWTVPTYVGRFNAQRGFIGIKACKFTKHYLTPPESMWEHEYPCHITIPAAAIPLANQLMAQEGYRMTMCAGKWVPGDWHSTTYCIVGGSMKRLLQSLEAAGHFPRGQWHVSM